MSHLLRLQAPRSPVPGVNQTPLGRFVSNLPPDQAGGRRQVGFRGDGEQSHHRTGRTGGVGGGGRTRLPVPGMTPLVPRTFAPTPANLVHRVQQKGPAGRAGFGAEHPQNWTSAPTGARTMTGQEVPRDGLPAPQVPRLASLGISEVFSSRWVSNAAPDQGPAQKLLGACGWTLALSITEAGIPRLGGAAKR